MITNKPHETTALACNSGGKIAAIRHVIVASTIQIEFRLHNGYPKKVPLFRQNPLQWIVCECDRRANEERERIERRNNATNAWFEGIFAIKEKEKVKSRAIKDAIRKIDAQQRERDYAKTKLKMNYDLYDIKARNMFVKLKLTTSMIKCTHRMNPH